MSIRDEIKNMFVSKKEVNPELVYSYIRNKTYKDYLQEAIDRELVWKKEFE